MMNEATSMSLSVCMESLVWHDAVASEICPRDSPRGHLNWISTVILVIYIYIWSYRGSVMSQEAYLYNHVHVLVRLNAI